MKKIRLALGKVYVVSGKKYEKLDTITGKTKVYTVADSLAKKLINSTDERDIPYFVEVTKDSEDLAAEESDVLEVDEELDGVGIEDLDVDGTGTDDSVDV